MTAIRKDRFSARGRAQASPAPRLSAQRDSGPPEANRSRDSMERAQLSFIMIKKKKKKKNLIFHFPFLNKKYAVGVPCGFSVKERIVAEL